MSSDGEFKWIIDGSLLQIMKSANRNDNFVSGLFHACGCTWRIKIWPYFSRLKLRGQTQCVIKIALISMKTGSKDFETHIYANCEGTSYSCTSNRKMSGDKLDENGGMLPVISMPFSKFMEMPVIAINVQINILGIWIKDGIMLCPPNSIFVHSSLTCNVFTKDLIELTTNHVIQNNKIMYSSALSENGWQFRISDKLRIDLHFWNCDEKRLPKMRMRALFKCEALEIDEKREVIGLDEYYVNGLLIIPFDIGFIEKFNKFRGNMFVFEVQVNIEENDKRTSHSAINDEQNANDVLKEDEMKNIAQFQKKEKEKVKNWLFNDHEVKLGQYFEKFIDNGYDSMAIIIKMDKDELSFIDKVGHKNEIWRWIQKLNNDKQNKAISGKKRARNDINNDLGAPRNKKQKVSKDQKDDDDDKEDEIQILPNPVVKKEKISPKRILIKNPLVIAICIEKYVNKDWEDLLGVAEDKKLIKALFVDTFRYDLKMTKSDYVKKRDLDNFLNECVDAMNTDQFDGLILLCSGHGTNKNEIVTSDRSDRENVRIDGIKDKLNVSAIQNRPKICIIDVCRGAKEFGVNNKNKKGGGNKEKEENDEDIDLGQNVSLHPGHNWVDLYANCPQYSTEDTNNGGILINALFKELTEITKPIKEYLSTTSIENILKRVAGRVTKSKANTQSSQ